MILWLHLYSFDLGYFVWLPGWKDTPTHAIAAMKELYEELIPTKQMQTVREDPERLTRVLAALHWRKTGTL